MILQTATKTFKSIDLEMEWSSIIRDERKSMGYERDLLERTHEFLNVRSILTFDSNGDPQYEVFDL